MLSLFTYENDPQAKEEKQHTCVWKVCRRDTAAEHSSVPATEIFGKILSIIVSASVFTIFWCGCVWGYKKAWMHKYIIDCDQSWFRSRSEVAAIEYSNYSNGRMLRRGSSNAESGSQLHSWQLGNPTKLCAAANASKQATRKCALAPSVKISNKIALGEIVNFFNNLRQKWHRLFICNKMSHSKKMQAEFSCHVCFRENQRKLSPALVWLGSTCSHLNSRESFSPQCCSASHIVLQQLLLTAAKTTCFYFGWKRVVYNQFSSEKIQLKTASTLRDLNRI